MRSWKMTHFFFATSTTWRQTKKTRSWTLGTGYEHKTGCFLFTPLPLEKIRTAKVGQVESQKSGSSRLDGWPFCWLGEIFAWEQTCQIVKVECVLLANFWFQTKITNIKHVLQSSFFVQHGSRLGFMSFSFAYLSFWITDVILSSCEGGRFPHVLNVVLFL